MSMWGGKYTAGWDAREIRQALEIIAHRDDVVLAAIRIMPKAEVNRRSGLARETINRIISRSPLSRPGR